MTNYTWKFSMGSFLEPTWNVHVTENLTKRRYLVGHAKRAKNAGWFVRISGVNGDPANGEEEIYIGDDVFPPDFMKTMLEMNK
jgi:hypothetical protein